MIQHCKNYILPTLLIEVVFFLYVWRVERHLVTNGDETNEAIPFTKAKEANILFIS